MSTVRGTPLPSFGVQVAVGMGVGLLLGLAARAAGPGRWPKACTWSASSSSSC